jgi:tetratricopeptide (TPR) repeat protein
LARVVFKISVGLVTGALILVAISLYMSNYYLKEQVRLAQAGDLPGARIDVERAALLDPFSPAPPTSMAYLELRQGRAEPAAEDLREAIRRDPANYKNYVELGNLQRQQLADPKAAAESYREALNHNPHDTALVSRLAEALLSTGDLEGAKAQYEYLQGLGRIPVEGLYTLGKIQVRLGDPTEGITIFKAAQRMADRELESGSLNEQQKTQRKALIDSLDLAIADALVVRGSQAGQDYRDTAAAREVLSQSSAEQAPSILALLDEDPESYRKSVLDAPIR